MGVAAIAGFYAFQRFSGHSSSVDALAEGLKTHLERQGDWATYQARLDATKSPAERQQLAAELSRHGIARLAVEEMADRDRLLLHLDSVADVAHCAQRFQGTLSGDGLRAYLGLLDATNADRWAEISAHAVSAELHATTPMAAPTNEEIGVAFSEAMRPMTTPDETRLNSVLQNAQVATPDDLCWASKHLMGTALALPEPARSTVLTTFTKLEAGLQ